MQIKRRSTSRKSFVGASGWKGKDREKERARGEKSSKKGDDILHGRREAITTPTPIPIGLCPNRRVMIVKEDRKVKSMSFLGEAIISSESNDSYYEGEETKTQRENIFHSMYLILGNLCSMIIDRGGCVNITSERLVKKLVLPTIVHPRPYRLQRLSEKEELLVDKQVEVTFTLGSYDDKVVL
ncbi:hypothetical protein CR513_51064, partial [Mucuna pruriens]